jgi:hypothetical protein
MYYLYRLNSVSREHGRYAHDSVRVYGYCLYRLDSVLMAG